MRSPNRALVSLVVDNKLLHRFCTFSVSSAEILCSPETEVVADPTKRAKKPFASSLERFSCFYTQSDPEKKKTLPHHCPQFLRLIESGTAKRLKEKRTKTRVAERVSCRTAVCAANKTISIKITQKQKQKMILYRLKHPFARARLFLCD